MAIAETTLADYYCAADPKAIARNLRRAPDISDGGPVDVRLVLAHACVPGMSREQAAIRRSTKYFLAADFIRMATQLSQEPPATLRQIMASARPPADHMWIEWEDRHRRAVLGLPDLPESARRVAFLVKPYTYGDFNGWSLSIFNWHDSGAGTNTAGWHGNFVAPAPPRVAAFRERDGGLRYSLKTLHGYSDTPFSPLTPEITDIPQGIFGQGYLTKWLENPEVDFDDLEAVASHVWGAPTAWNGAVLAACVNECVARGGGPEEDTLRDLLARGIMEAAGSPVLLMSILFLLNQHQQCRVLDVPRGERRRIAGTYRPTFEHRVVSLVRPDMSFRDLVRDTPGGPRDIRFHAVEGHFAHSHRKGRMSCDHEWAPRVDDEGHRLGSDQDVCARCGKLRWWKPRHHRGDPKIGTVVKDFEVKTR